MLYLSAQGAAEVYIKEGEESIFVKLINKASLRNSYCCDKLQDGVIEADADKFTREIIPTGEEHIVVASLELPIELIKGEDGHWIVSASKQILYPSFYKTLLKKYKKVKWVGHLKFPENLSKEEKAEIGKLLREKNCAVVDLDPELYSSFASYFESALYPYFHNFVSLSEVSNLVSENWDSYIYVNRRFAETIIEYVGTNTLIWINDIPLLLCPYQIIRRNHKANIGIYIHSTFPSCEVFKLSPYCEEILASLLCCNIIGFHLFSYADNFLKACRRILGSYHKTSHVLPLTS